MDPSERRGPRAPSAVGGLSTVPAESFVRAGTGPPVAPSAAAAGAGRHGLSHDHWEREGGPDTPSRRRSACLHAVWSRLRVRGFVLPRGACTHDVRGLEWEAYDADLAGCRACGAQHDCSLGCCATEANEEGHLVCVPTGPCVGSLCTIFGHLVCVLTGLCVRSLSFSESEYVDTALAAAAARHARPTIQAGEPPRPQEDGGEPWGEAVAVHVRHVICSAERDRCVNLEQRKLWKRWAGSMERELRHFKERNPGVAPVMPLLVEAVVRASGAGRDIHTLLGPERVEVAEACAESILRVLRLLNRVVPGAVPQCKLRGFTVGLLYMMRQGISAHGVVLLPRRAGLRRVLPLEGHLQQMLGVRGKCITETENVVKAVMRTVDRETLVRLGVVGVDRRLGSA